MHRESFILFITFLLIGCNSNDRKIASKEPLTIDSSDWVVNSFDNKEDSGLSTVVLIKSTEDSVPGIRDNFKRINSISRWTKIVEKGLSESGEGGEANYYYQGKDLEKIVTKNFGEMGQLLTEYYLMKGELSFVLERRYRYNRPIYYDSVAMKEANDTVAFDFNKSEIAEQRSYFVSDKIIRLAKDERFDDNPDKSMATEMRILQEYRMLMKLLKERSG